MCLSGSHELGAEGSSSTYCFGGQDQGYGLCWFAAPDLVGPKKWQNLYCSDRLLSC